MTVIEERIYYPTGCDPDDINAHSFAVHVTWRGQGKWMVSRMRSTHHQMSRTGKWLWCPLKMVQMRWCRFDFETACRLAEAAVNDVSINGRTWAQWEQWQQEKASA